MLIKYLHLGFIDEKLLYKMLFIFVYSMTTSLYSAGPLQGKDESWKNSLAIYKTIYKTYVLSCMTQALGDHFRYDRLE